MKILAYVHGYPPALNAGAEVMIHQILLDLKARGHEVTVMTQNPGAREYDGIRISNSSLPIYEQLFDWCDIVITHLNSTKDAINLAKKHGKKIVHLIHNDFVYFLHKDYEYHVNGKINPDDAALVVANSEWVKHSINPEIPSIVVNPPTKPSKYKVDTSRQFITMINMAMDKGGWLLWKIAKQMPEKQFMAVKGGWGNQVILKLPNVTVVENTTDINSVYSRSRVVLMPSHYESWGRVAIEAACSGIPVIAASTPGLKESLGSSGIFVDNHEVNNWVDAIRSLDNPDTYAKYSAATEARANDLAVIFEKQVDTLETRLLEILNK